MKLPGDLVAKRFAGLSHAERQLDALRIDHIGEIGEDALRGLGPQIDGVCGILDRPHEGLEHQVELARLSQLAAAFRTAIALKMVGAKALLTILASTSGSVKFCR